MHQIIRLLILITGALILAGCASQQLDTLSVFQRLQVNSAYSNAERLLEKDMPAEAAEQLWDSAAGIIAPHRQIMQVRAVEILLDHGRPLKAYRYLIKIDDTQLTAGSLLRKQIAAAHFYNETSQYKKVIALLPPELIKHGDRPMQIRALRLTANALAETGNLVPTIEARLTLDTLLEKQQQTDNINLLWQALLFSDPWKTLQSQQKKHASAVKAWLELATLATPEIVDIPKLNQQFERWKKTHKQWTLPATAHDELLSRWQYLDFTPKKIAVLLPLTGNYAKLGRVVQSGFLSHHSESTSDFTIRFYNTDSEKTTAEIYRHAAEEENVDMVIGPLLKPRVNDLASTVASVPTIALNYSEISPPTHSEFFQFGLLPEDEARQVAERVWNDGFHFVLVMVADTAWGERMYNTFAQHYLELGGIIRETAHYNSTFVDYSATIESLFQLDQSHKRYRNLVGVLGEEIKFIPRIRDDADAAVLFADSKRATLIYPQMKYHYADKFPVYASSHVYKPDSKHKTRDLDGIRYCDAPIVFDYDLSIFTDTEQEALLRLYALGADAYQLIPLFRRMNIVRTTFDGLTGKISIVGHKRFYRELEWGSFSYGKPIPNNYFY